MTIRAQPPAASLPFGRTEEVDGDVTFSVEMGWSSGCDRAEWAILGFRRKNA